jgi:hypothetical protein
VLGLLRQHLRDVAHVITVDEALEVGLFGPQTVSAELRRRLGDILVLPHDGRFVSWRERSIMENRFNGHHGGLAPAELISALGVIGRL